MAESRERDGIALATNQVAKPWAPNLDRHNSTDNPVKQALARLQPFATGYRLPEGMVELAACLRPSRSLVFRYA